MIISRENMLEKLKYASCIAVSSTAVKLVNEYCHAKDLDQRTQINLQQ